MLLVNIPFLLLEALQEGRRATAKTDTDRLLPACQVGCQGQPTAHPLPFPSLLAADFIQGSYVCPLPPPSVLMPGTWSPSNRSGPGAVAPKDERAWPCAAAEPQTLKVELSHAKEESTSVILKPLLFGFLLDEAEPHPDT